MSSAPFTLRLNLLITDIGFILYWAITALGLLPAEWLFKDYHDSLLVAWNWSFAPVDIAASLLGILAVRAIYSRSHLWRAYVLLSIALTFCAGLMAISFWTLRHDFNVWWLLPNLYLAVWPLFYIKALIQSTE